MIPPTDSEHPLELGDEISPEGMIRLRRAWITHVLAGRFGAAEYLKQYLPPVREGYDRNSTVASGRRQAFAIAGEIP